MTDYDKAFDVVVGNEGGYVNDPRDPGGETKFGISKRAYPELNIRSLTLTDAKRIYKRDYWDRVSGDLLPWPLNLFVFDYAVNSGVRKASLDLQKTLGASPDGKIGPMTFALIPVPLTNKTLMDYLDRREDYVMSLPGSSVFGKGWKNRIDHLRTFIPH